MLAALASTCAGDIPVANGLARTLKQRAIEAAQSYRQGETEPSSSADGSSGGSVAGAISMLQTDVERVFRTLERRSQASEMAAAAGSSVAPRRSLRATWKPCAQTAA